MSAEYVSAVASIVTAVIIGATAIATVATSPHAIGQQHQRLLALRALLDDERHSHARDLVLSGAADKTLAEPGCRRYLRAIHTGGVVLPEDARYAAIIAEFTLVLNVFEGVGSMVKRGTIGKAEFLDLYCYVVDRSWRRLEGLIAYVRAVSENDAISKNFEYLTVISRDWIENGEPTYPRGLPEIAPPNPYPLNEDETKES